MTLRSDQLERYSRHILLEEIGGRGQEKLLASRVLIIGVGALGAPAAIYLAAAGVGTIGLADADVVDITNLHRQVIHFTSDVGKPKVISAAEKIRALNPDVKVKTHSEWVTAKNIAGMIADYDFVIDGTDNFAAKFLINNACVLGNKPYSHGSIMRFEGQTITVRPGISACYRCAFPEPPPDGAIPTCVESGVLGVLPGVIGMIQATEAIKFLLGLGELLTNHLLTYDARALSFQKLTVRRNPDCPICGAHPSITELKDVRSNETAD